MVVQSGAVVVQSGAVRALSAEPLHTAGNLLKLGPLARE